MFIALRDLAYAKGRFLLMGLISNNVSGLSAAPVTHFSFQYDDRPTFRSSLVDRPMWEGWQARPGVGHAEPLGHTSFNGRNQRDEPLEFVLWGVRPGSRRAVAPAGWCGASATSIGWQP